MFRIRFTFVHTYANISPRGGVSAWDFLLYCICINLYQHLERGALRSFIQAHTYMAYDFDSSFSSKITIGPLEAAFSLSFYSGMECLRHEGLMLVQFS